LTGDQESGPESRLGRIEHITIFAARMQPSTRARLSPLARYVLEPADPGANEGARGS
jgi:hypothetical protein